MITLPVDPDTLDLIRKHLRNREKEIIEEADGEYQNAYTDLDRRKALQSSLGDSLGSNREWRILRATLMATVEVAQEALTTKGVAMDQGVAEALVQYATAKISRWTEQQNRDKDADTAMRVNLGASRLLDDVRSEVEIMVARGRVQARASESIAYVRIRDLELALRKLIRGILDREAGPGWEKSRVPGDVRSEWDRVRTDLSRMAYPWAVPVSDDLELANFDHYKKIIVRKDNWPYFEPILRNARQTESILEELNSLRTTIAHMRPLSNQAMERLDSQASHVLSLLHERRDVL